MAMLGNREPITFELHRVPWDLVRVHPYLFVESTPKNYGMKTMGKKKKRRRS